MAVSSLVPAAAGITVAEGTAAGWSSGEPDWTLIATSTTTGTSTTFSGISGYRYLKLYVRDYANNTNTTPRVTFNSTSTGYSQSINFLIDGGTQYYNHNADSDAYYIAYNVTSTGYTHNGGWLEISDVNTSLPYKTLKSHGHFINSSTGGGHASSWGTWKNTSAITSLTVTLYSSAFSSNSGGIALYGAN